MKVIYNTILPRKGFKAINLFGFIFARKEYKDLSTIDLNHERIHTRQMQELLFVFFYLWYGIEWLIRLVQYRNSKQAYYNISFEREAYCNEQNTQYLKSKKFYSSIKYLSITKTK